MFGNETNNSSRLTDQDLLSKLLRIPKRDLHGDNIQEILNHLLKHSEKSERVMLVKEIAHRYGEKRLHPGEVFQKSTQVYEHFKMRLGELSQESFHTLILDNKHRIIREKIITLGTLNQSLIHPRECFAPAIELRAAAIILVHNHPSGDPLPSNQDIEITKRLSEVGTLVGIKVLDHIIIGTEKYYSFVDQTIMP